MQCIIMQPESAKQRDRSIGLIQISHMVYSHDVAWALRPYCEYIRTQIGLSSDAARADQAQKWHAPCLQQ